MDYTRRLEMDFDEMNEDEIEEEDILAYLDGSSFMDFGDGLRRIIRRKMSENDRMDEASYLVEMAKKQGIAFNRNTVKNWFDGKAPKKGDKDRERMFAVCFALRLNLEETDELFNKVYCDRTFNLRNYREFIYFCGINNGWDYTHCQELVDKAALSDEKDDRTVYTEYILEAAGNITSDEGVLAYIERSGHNFDLRNTSAKKLLDSLIYDVRGRKEETELLEKNRIDQKCSYIAQECAVDSYTWAAFKEKDSNAKTKKSLSSIATMVDIIYGIDIARAREDVMDEGRTLLKNAKLPQAIKGRLPVSQTFSKSEPTAEELRKMIILLFSYKFWFEKDYRGADIGFEEYRDELNDRLCKAYLQKLYIGNPFDWLFMYCTMCEDSLGMFRNIIADGLLAE